MTTLAQAMREAGRRLAAAGTTSTPQLDVELVLGDVVGLDRVGLRVEGTRELGGDDLGRFEAAVARLASGEPVQYVRGRAPFRDLDLLVDSRVLVPRPETEALVDIALAEVAAIRDRGEAAGSGTVPVLVVDACTGSGCVAIAIDREAAVAWGDGAIEVVATDVSRLALDVAAANVVRCGARVELLEGSLLAPLAGRSAHVVVANPPYVPRADAASLEAKVRDHEPHVALFAPEEDPLGVVSALVAQAAQTLLPGGLVAIEHGAGQGIEVLALLGEHGFVDIHDLDDLAGHDRIAVARRPA